MAAPLSVKVSDVDLSEFPRVNVVFELASPDKLDFKQLTNDAIRLIEEEVPVSNLSLVPCDTQLSLALLLDDSGRQDHTLSQLKRSIYRLIDRLAYHDEAAVVTFARGTKVLSPLTSDKRILTDAVGQLKAYGASALFDGLAMAIAEVHRGKGKRAVLLISDGIDEVYPGGRPLSEETLPAVIQMAREHDIEIYTIGVGTRVDRKMLTTLSRSTGGVYMHAPSDVEIGELVLRISMSFHGLFKLVYDSPRPAEDNQLREAKIQVDFRGHHGEDLFGYRFPQRTDTDLVTVKRTDAYQPGTGNLQVFTLGLRQKPLPLRFFLFDRYNRPIRQGMTSPDGYGKLDSRDPELIKIPPGTYRLELEVPGTTLRYVHPGIKIVAGETEQVRYRYSKLLFRRNGVVWYDTPHPYGDTSELISLKLVNTADSRVCHAGRLIDFTLGKETFIWLEEGTFRIELANLWHQSAPPDVEKSILRNSLEADIACPGTNLLFFDVADDDFVFDKDVLADAQPMRPKKSSRTVVVNVPDAPERSDDGPTTTDDRDPPDPPEEEFVDRTEPNNRPGVTAEPAQALVSEREAVSDPVAARRCAYGRLLELAGGLETGSAGQGNLKLLIASLDEKSDPSTPRDPPGSGIDSEGVLASRIVTGERTTPSIRADPSETGRDKETRSAARFRSTLRGTKAEGEGQDLGSAPERKDLSRGRFTRGRSRLRRGRVFLADELKQQRLNGPGSTKKSPAKRLLVKSKNDKIDQRPTRSSGDARSSGMESCSMESPYQTLLRMVGDSAKPRPLPSPPREP